MSKDKALIVIDVQVDFCPGGSLAVTGGDTVAAEITEFIKANRSDYATIVATADWHHDPGSHFAEYGQEPDFSTSWPVHCVAGTQGAEYHPNLSLPVDTLHFIKGEYSPGYSAFEAHLKTYSDKTLSLNHYLMQSKIETLDIVGIATDFCVFATVSDALLLGYEVNVIGDLTAAVDPGSINQKYDAWTANPKFNFVSKEDYVSAPQ